MACSYTCRCFFALQKDPELEKNSPKYFIFFHRFYKFIMKIKYIFSIGPFEKSTNLVLSILTVCFCDVHETTRVRITAYLCQPEPIALTSCDFVDA